MISVAEALDILRKNLPDPRIIDITLGEALNRRLADDVFAPEPSPRYTSSAMDGYAVCWQDVKDIDVEGPVTLPVVGESQAGVPYAKSLEQGTAIQINTGAMLPAGSDTVIRVEDTDLSESDSGARVIVKRCKKQGQDVRYEGEEFQRGAKILPKGLILKARQIALLSAVGQSTVPVFAQPRVSLFITGTELAHYGEGEITPYQVRDSNAPMLECAIEEAGAALTECVHVQDDLDKTISEMRRLLDGGNDIILCTGGVSVGKHDHVKEAAEEVGFSELFWKIRQKPGKPLYVARRENTLLFGLPGNPVSAFMCFQNFVIPSLASLQGVQILQKSVTAVAQATVVNDGKRTNYFRVSLRRDPHSVPTFRLLDRQGSHMLTSIVEADGYVVVDPGTILNAGDLAEVYLF